MARKTTAFLAAALAISLASTAWAQTAWPEYPPNDPALTARGPGFYFAIYKLILLLFPFWLWVKSADWIGRDTLIHGDKTGLKPEVWNPLYVFSFFVAFILAISIPLFIVGYLILVIAWVAPLMIYVMQRNPKVQPDDRVFTPAHIKKWFSELGKRKRQDESRRSAYDYGAPVDFIGQSGDKGLDQANLITARQSLAFVPAKELMADAINSRAEKILLDFTADAVTVKYMIDGVWHNAEPRVHEKDPLNRQLGDAILEVYKKIANLNPVERRARQEAKMTVTLAGSKQNTLVAAQGTPTGERVLLSFLPILKTAPTFEDLGMREPHREKLREALAEKSNLVVFCSMPTEGLTATWVAALKMSDRYMRDYVTLQDVAKPEPDVENVESASGKFNAAAGQTPMTVLPAMRLKQPEVYCVPEISDGETLNAILKEIVDEQRKGIVSIRAKEAVEGILRLLMLKPDPQQFAKCLGMVVNQRLIRKLCDQCKEPFEPPPEVLQRLGIPAGRVQVLYREKQPLPPGVEQPKPKKGDPPLICPQCRGIGYFGRAAIFEILQVDDRMREAILKQPKIEVLRQVSKQVGNWSLQEEGILLLAQGITSFQELQRVLKT